MLLQECIDLHACTKTQKLADLLGRKSGIPICAGDRLLKERPGCIAARGEAGGQTDREFRLSLASLKRSKAADGKPFRDSFQARLAIHHRKQNRLYVEDSYIYQVRPVSSTISWGHHHRRTSFHPIFGTNILPIVYLDRTVVAFSPDACGTESIDRRRLLPRIAVDITACVPAIQQAN